VRGGGAVPEPVKAYHGTKAEFGEFDPAFQGSATDAGFLGKAFYFSEWKEVARDYAGKEGRVVEADLSLRKPYVVQLGTKGYQESLIRQLIDDFGVESLDPLISTKSTKDQLILDPAKLTAFLKGKGYDAVSMEFYSPARDGLVREFAVFDKSSIRTAPPVEPPGDTADLAPGQLTVEELKQWSAPVSGVPGLKAGQEVFVKGYGKGEIVREATPEEKANRFAGGDVVVWFTEPAKPEYLAPGTAILMRGDGVKPVVSLNKPLKPKDFVQPVPQAETPVTPVPAQRTPPHIVPGSYTTSRTFPKLSDSWKAKVSPGVGGPKDPPADVAWGEPGKAPVFVENLPKDLTNTQRFVFTLQNAAYQSNNPTVIEAAERMVSLDILRMQETEARRAEDFKQWKRLPRDWQKKKDTRFFELMDTKLTPEEIDARTDLPDVVKEVLQHFKARSEANRLEIIENKRAVVRAMLGGKSAEDLIARMGEARTAERDIERDGPLPEGLTHDFVLEEVTLFGKPVNRIYDMTEGRFLPREEAVGLLERAYVSDEWGRPYSHIYHAFFGRYMIYYIDANGEVNFINRAETQAEAAAKLKAFQESNPTLPAASFHVKPESHVPRDMVRMSTPAFRRLVGEIAKEVDAVDAEIRDAVRGEIGVKTFRSKFYGPLHERKGAEGYSRDMWRVWEAEQNGFMRWKYLSQIQREVQPLIEDLQHQGFGRWAKHLENQLEYLWGGKRGQVAERVDELMAKVPFFGRHARPLAIERWMGVVRAVNYWRHLQTPRFFVVNSLQPLQTVYPIIGEARMMKLLFELATPKGRARMKEVWDRHNIGTLAGGKLFEAELRHGGLGAKMPAGVSERNNQRISFIALYDFAKDVLKYPEAQAAEYGRVHGQLQTQFLFTRANQPYLLQGPFRQTVFQYKRFQMSLLGHLTNMLYERGVPTAAKRAMKGKGPRSWANPLKYQGVARWFLAMNVVGGLKSLWTVGTVGGLIGTGGALFELYHYLEEQFGKDAADTIVMGLPGLLGTDISGSFSVFEEPPGDTLAEKLGNTLLGPTGQTAVRFEEALRIQKKVNDELSALTGGRALLETSPSLNPLRALLDLLNEDTAELDLQGRLRHHQKVGDLWMKAFSLRPVDRSIVSMEIDWIVARQFEYDKAVDQVTRKVLAEKYDEATRIAMDWNAANPTMMIDNRTIMRRSEARFESRHLDMLQRRLEMAPEAIRQAAFEKGIGVPD
jgi:hypothetical protein